MHFTENHNNGCKVSQRMAPTAGIVLYCKFGKQTDTLEITPQLSKYLQYMKKFEQCWPVSTLLRGLVKAVAYTGLTCL